MFVRLQLDRKQYQKCSIICLFLNKTTKLPCCTNMRHTVKPEFKKGFRTSNSETKVKMILKKELWTKINYLRSLVPNSLLLPYNLYHIKKAFWGQFNSVKGPYLVIDHRYYGEMFISSKQPEFIALSISKSVKVTKRMQYILFLWQIQIQ